MFAKVFVRGVTRRNWRPLRSVYRTVIAAPLTAQQYEVKRGDYAKVDEGDMSEFRKILGKDHVLVSQEDLETYNVDWMKNFRGQSEVVLRPESTQQVAAILAHCNRRRLAVVPQGGNTGLVGGSVPVFDEVVLSLARMNEVLHLDTGAGVLVCQSGCVLQSLDDMLAKHDLMMPLDLGAKGSCHIGGNVSTNAGGVRLLRYGSLRGNVLGVEAVLADGTVMDLLSTVRKDNTGFDLKQLFIGGEGTVGVVTAVSILTPARPKAVNLMFLSHSSFHQVLQLYSRVRGHLAEILSAVEFLDGECMELVVKHLGYSRPLPPNKFYTLIETSGSNDEHDKQKLQSFLEQVTSDGVIEEGTMANDLTKVNALWRIREEITIALGMEGVMYKYDISVPQVEMYNLVETMRQRCAGRALCTVGYGHLGDGNLHLNVIARCHSRELTDLIEPYVYQKTAEHRGSISAEHGMGFKKAGYIHYSKPPAAVQVMQSMKQLLDPRAILNPYKTLPAS